MRSSVLPPPDRTQDLPFPRTRGRIPTSAHARRRHCRAPECSKASPERAGERTQPGGVSGHPAGGRHDPPKGEGVRD